MRGRKPDVLTIVSPDISELERIARDSSLISTRLSRDFTLCLSGLRLRLAVFDGF